MCLKMFVNALIKFLNTVNYCEVCLRFDYLTKAVANLIAIGIVSNMNMEIVEICKYESSIGNMFNRIRIEYRIEDDRRHTQYV